jgi:hypothetical protein
MRNKLALVAANIASAWADWAEPSRTRGRLEYVRMMVVKSAAAIFMALLE